MSSKASLPAPEQKHLPSARSLLRDTFALFGRHTALYLGYAGWMLVPLIGLVFIRITLGSTELAEQLIAVLQGISLALNVWVYASICQLTFSLHTHDKAIATPVPLFVPFLVLVSFGLLLLISLPLFVLPGLVVITWFAYAPAIAILERGGFFASFITSKELVRGMFWQTFLRVCGLFVPLGIFYFLIAIALGLLYPELFTLDLAVPVPLAADITLSLAEIAFMPITVIYLTLLYLARKNG